MIYVLIIIINWGTIIKVNYPQHPQYIIGIRPLIPVGTVFKMVFRVVFIAK